MKVKLIDNQRLTRQLDSFEAAFTETEKQLLD